MPPDSYVPPFFFFSFCSFSLAPREKRCQLRLRDGGSCFCKIITSAASRQIGLEKVSEKIGKIQVERVFYSVNSLFLRIWNDRGPCATPKKPTKTCAFHLEEARNWTCFRRPHESSYYVLLETTPRIHEILAVYCCVTLPLLANQRSMVMNCFSMSFKSKKGFTKQHICIFQRSYFFFLFFSFFFF